MLRGPFTRARLLAVVALGVGAVLGALFVSLWVGEGSTSLFDALSGNEEARTIVFSIRLPRAVLAGLVGAALAASGCVLQAWTRNALADPFVLGVSGGSALGATVVLALGSTLWAGTTLLSATTVGACAGALLATLLVLGLGRLGGARASDATLLGGVIFNAFALAVVTFIKVLVAPDVLGEVLYWLAGSIGVEPWASLGVLAAIEVVCVAAMWRATPSLNALAFGELDARTLGADVDRTRHVVFWASSVAVAAAVALSGLVGFVGLLVPHLGRLWLGHDQRRLLPASALFGAAFLMLADAGARALFSVFHAEPPVGVLTALLGGPLFLLLLRRRGAAFAAEKP